MSAWSATSSASVALTVSWIVSSENNRRTRSLDRHPRSVGSPDHGVKRRYRGLWGHPARCRPRPPAAWRREELGSLPYISPRSARPRLTASRRVLPLLPRNSSTRLAEGRHGVLVSPHFGRRARVRIWWLRRADPEPACGPSPRCRASQAERQEHILDELGCVQVSVFTASARYSGALTLHLSRRKYAYPHDDLEPIAETWTDGRNGWGASLVDALTTLVSFRTSATQR